MKEIWKDIKGYEGLYVVSSFGQVKNLKSGKILKQTNSGGSKAKRYKAISLRKDAYNSFILVHRLVAMAFIPNPENKPQVNHKDGSKFNNKVSNLEWCTCRENILHAVKNNLWNAPKGTKARLVKLNEKQVLEIRRKYKPYVYMEKDLAAEYGVSRSAIDSIIMRKNWKHI